MKQIIKRRAASFLILALLTAMLPVPASAAGTVSYSDLKGVTMTSTAHMPIVWLTAVESILT